MISKKEKINKYLILVENKCNIKNRKKRQYHNKRKSITCFNHNSGLKQCDSITIANKYIFHVYNITNLNINNSNQIHDIYKANLSKLPYDINKKYDHPYDIGFCHFVDNLKESLINIMIFHGIIKYDK